MYPVASLEICTEIFKLCHIRLQLFARPYTNAENLDFGLRKLLYQNYDYTPMLDGIRSLLSSGEILYIQDEFGISYNFFLLTDGPEQSPYEFGALGPWRQGEFSDEIVHTIMEKCGIKTEHAHLLWSCLNRVPQNMDREKWIALCTRTIGKLISPTGDVKFLVQDTSLLKFPEFHAPQLLDDTAFHNYQVHNLAGGYSLELKLLGAVKKGNYSQAEDLAHKYVNFQLQYRSKDHITPSMIGIELNALLRHAAHEAVGYSLRLEEVYTKYCRLLGKNHSEIPQATMIRDYCNLVTQYANRHQSPIVRSCVDYIDFFYATPISLRELAQQNAITEQYLATLFRKELNMTFVEYLNETRISHAKIMLKDKDMSVQEISARCGFNDSSYFSRTFKKLTGMSPMLFRSSILMEVNRSNKG